MGQQEMIRAACEYIMAQAGLAPEQFEQYKVGKEDIEQFIKDYNNGKFDKKRTKK